MPPAVVHTGFQDSISKMQVKMKIRDYHTALQAMRRLRRSPRPASHRNVPFYGRAAVEGMKEWAGRLGIDGYVHRARLIHVTGSKGKGSTCAFVVALLNSFSDRTGEGWKIGQYSSPHLLDETERIRVNGRPISQEIFAQHAWEIIDRLHIGSDPRGPRLLQAITLLAFRIFEAEGVDLAVVETNTGGRFCATNFIEYPSVTAVTRVVLDHVPELGTSLEEIAWHKAGIFKSHCPAVSVPQAPEVAKVLEQEAIDAQSNLTFAKRRKDVFPDNPQLAENFSLAVDICNTFLHSMGASLLEEDILMGLTKWNWPGRFQIVERGGIRWFLDGAHNVGSMYSTVDWFYEGTKQCSSQAQRGRALILAWPGTRHDEDGITNEVLEAILRRPHPDLIILTKDGKTIPQEDEDKTLALYASIFKQSTTSEVLIELSPTLALARVEEANSLGKGLDILVTGSLYLVGVALNYVGEPI